MQVDLISYILSIKDARLRLQFRLALQCAPLLKGLKASSLLPINTSEKEELQPVLVGTDISYLILNDDQKRKLLFLYMPEELGSLLQKEEARGFLDKNGYSGKELGSSLRQLSFKMLRYAEGCCQFPHEIGIFLGYPVRDVEAFIVQKGRNFLLSGYWKVYHSPAQAQLTFHAYDRAKVSVVNELLAGRTLKEIVQDV